MHNKCLYLSLSIKFDEFTYLTRSDTSLISVDIADSRASMSGQILVSVFIAEFDELFAATWHSNHNWIMDKEY